LTQVIRRYCLAIILVVMATLLTQKTQPVLGEISPLFFVAVMLSTWFGGIGPGLAATALAGWASAYYFYDIPAGTGIFGWDDVLRLGVFLMVALLISFLLNMRRRAERQLRIANDNLESRVIERTRELEASNRIVARDITELKRLEKEVLEISEKEQRRIGHDLHDGLGQELTGLAFLCQNIARKLAEASRPEAAELQRISAVINSAIEKTRDLAKGLSPVEWGQDGLSAALQNLAIRVRESYGIPCEFHRERAVAVESHTAATHLYRIAQEALSNAARHSHASRIWISLDQEGEEVILSIQDNGTGIQPQTPLSRGMGLHLMPYRARMIGAAFDLQPRSGGGTVVRCAYRKSLESPSDHNMPAGDSLPPPADSGPESKDQDAALQNTAG
jgi:signal transduction histidine kinase